MIQDLHSSIKDILSRMPQDDVLAEGYEMFQHAGRKKKKEACAGPDWDLIAAHVNKALMVSKLQCANRFFKMTERKARMQNTDGTWQENKKVAFTKVMVRKSIREWSRTDFKPYPVSRYVYPILIISIYNVV
jgi:hypothetical protein